MTSPGLKPTVQLRGEGERAELFDATTTRTLALSTLEAKLLSLWDGLASATHLTDLARAQGVVIEPRQASIFFERLQRAGFLAATPTSDSGLVPDAPGLDHLEDRVPKLRGDLLIGRAPGAKGVLQVTDPVKSRSFTLYDFEVSIARLLDGRRTAGQLLEAAVRLGIPVNLESLRKFVRQLRGYHFIDETAATVASPPPSAATPETWTPEQRELYDSAVRFARLGKLDRALEYLAALLEMNPALEEPLELKARLEAQRAGEVEVDVNFDSLHGVPNPLAARPAEPASTEPPPPAAPSALDLIALHVPAPAAPPAMDFMTLHASPAPATSAPPGEPVTATASGSARQPAAPQAPAPTASSPRPVSALVQPSAASPPRPASPLVPAPAASAPRPASPLVPPPPASAPRPASPLVPAPAASPPHTTSPLAPAPAASAPRSASPLVPAPAASAPRPASPLVPPPPASAPRSASPLVPAPAASPPHTTSPLAPAPSASAPRPASPLVPPPSASAPRPASSLVPAPPPGSAPRPASPLAPPPPASAPRPASPLVPAPAASPPHTTSPLAPPPAASPPHPASPLAPAPAASPPRPASPLAPPPAASPPRPVAPPASPPRGANVEVNYSTPSALLRHDEDPFRLYEPGVVVAPRPAAPPASTPSIIIEEDLGAEARAASDPGSTSSVIAAFAAMAAESPPHNAAPSTASPDATSAPTAAGASSGGLAASPGAPAATSPAPDAAPAVSTSTPRADTQDEATEMPDLGPSGIENRRRWLKRGLVGGGVVLVLALLGGGAWLLRSVPRHESLPCALEPVDAATVTAPWAGTLAPPAVESGGTATAQQPLGAMDVAPANARLTAIVKRHDELAHQRAGLKRGTEQAIKAATKKRDAARKARADIDVKLGRAKALPPAQQKSKVALLEKFVVLTQKRLDAAEAALEKLTHQKQLARLAEEATALDAEAAALKAQVAAAAIVSTGAGRVTWLVKPGDAVEAGAPVAKVDSGRWRVRAQARVKLPAGVPVEASVVTGGRTLEVRRLDVQPDAVLGVVESATPLGPSGTLELAAGERHAYELLFGEE